MEEYCRLPVLSHPRESTGAFNKRLIEFWSFLLRTRPAEYARVCAEAAAVLPHGDRVGRDYLLERSAVEAVEAALTAAGLDFEPADRDDLFTKYEAAPPDWFQIEH